MFEAIVKSFPMAIGIAMSVGPILAVIILLMTPNAKTNSLSLFFGWFLGIFGVGTLIIFVPGVLNEFGGLSDETGWVKIIAGILLLILIIPIQLKKPKPGTPVKNKPFFNKIDKFGAGKSFAIGLLFSAFSLKNAALSASGAAHIHTTRLIDYFETLFGVFLFSLIASSTIIIPIIIYFLAPDKTAQLFLNWKNWLIKNNSNIAIVMLTGSGILLLYLGIKIHMT